MPAANFGTGTLYYGKRDFWPDDSYITTEFIAVFWIPLIPIRSLRVNRRGMDAEGIGIVTRYAVSSRTRPNLKQVGSIYGFVGLLLGFTVGYSNAADNFPRILFEILVAGALAGIGTLSFLPFLLRKRSRRSGPVTPL